MGKLADQRARAAEAIKTRILSWGDTPAPLSDALVAALLSAPSNPYDNLFPPATSGKVVVTAEQVKQIFGRAIASQQFDDLIACLDRFAINKTKARACQFFAQIGHESGGLQFLKELGDAAYFTQNYEGRADLGNTQPGDGAKYAGAGVIQLTGRANYQRFSDYVKDIGVVDEGQDYVATRYPFTSAGWFWQINKLNDLVDRGGTVQDVTQVVNGGQNGIDDRLNYYYTAVAVISEVQ